jgi:thymidylate synthase
MPFKLIAHELIWFLRGDTNIKYLIDNNCHIWDGDAYRHYVNLNTKQNEIDKAKGYSTNPHTKEEFIDRIKAGKFGDGFSFDRNYKSGDLGEVYGAQWRNWDNKGIDQIKKVIDAIKKNPFGRRHIVSAWNPAEVDNMALPPCHLLFQFNCRPIPVSERIGIYECWDGVTSIPNLDGQTHEFCDGKGVPKFYLDCALTQRSCDTILGVPFNIASYALLTEIVAKMCNMAAGEFVWNGNDTHIYDNHMEAAQEQLKREPKELCRLKVSDRVKSFNDISELTIDDLSIHNYESHPAIKAELSVGV